MKWNYPVIVLTINTLPSLIIFVLFSENKHAVAVYT